MSDPMGSLLRRLSEQGAKVLELACIEHPSADRGEARRFVVTMPVCLGELSDADLLRPLAAGIDIALRVDGCAAPYNLRARMRRIRRFLRACGQDERRIFDEEPEARRRRVVHRFGSLTLNRRQMFGLSVDLHGQDGPAGASQRALAVAALRTLAADGSADDLAALPLASARLRATDCWACGVCVRACDVGALRLEREGSTFTLSLAHRECIDCGTCVRLCPEHALKRTGSLTWAAALDDAHSVLDSGPIRDCERCGVAFRPHDMAEQLCPACEFRRRNPFGSSQR